MGLGGHDVFVSFNNDGNTNAVRNVRTLRVLLVSGGVSPSGYVRGQLELAFRASFRDRDARSRGD